MSAGDGHGAEQVPQTSAGVPPVPPQRPVVPPAPAQAPRSVPVLADWLRIPRPEARPGVWRVGYRPRRPEDPERTPARSLVSAALVSFLVGWLLGALLWNGYLGSYWLWPLVALTPDAWRGTMAFVVASWVYYGLVALGLVVFFGRLGRWPEVLRRVRDYLQGGQGAAPGDVPEMSAAPAAVPAEQDPAMWPQVRAAGVVGAAEAAERLTEELRAGRMSDVDQARITRAWQAARSRGREAEFVQEVLARGAAACMHGSRERDLPVRTARHDLVLRQVRIGTGVDGERTPVEYRGAGIAVDPDLLGTSAVVVGPPGSGKSARLVRPVVESLCLQALAGQAALIVVSTGEAGRGGGLPESAFDVVVDVADRRCPIGLDLYGGVDDPDEASAMLAEALVGDLVSTTPGGDSRRAATLLAAVVGPFQAAHGRCPEVAELRALLDGGEAVEALRRELEGRGRRAEMWVRELDAYARQAGRSGGLDGLLADRIALLDRPAFEGLFTPPGGYPEPRRPFSVRALDRPVRARIELPQRGHPEASRILARLLLAQFAECAAARRDQSLFAGLVLDDAAQTITPQAVRGLQRLRSVHAGAVLTLRGLDEVPEHLRGPLLGTVGCRVVCAGVSPWDAERFAEAWGTEWVETRTVTNRQLVSDEPLTRLMHGLRRLATGRYVSAESVTVRKEQRQRWSASELANELPAGHAVLSVTTVHGERTPPVLTRLGE
ncbi:ATP-binding protein [Streptomyces cacaoi]|uniref:ATP-binding protein n=1 Tax=Streptomyces cacaoi TaxID=1898 RepID=UPI001659D6BE|nr:ATP-binding protein [Streptomyces cacaoi]